MCAVVGGGGAAAPEAKAQRHKVADAVSVHQQQEQRAVAVKERHEDRLEEADRRGEVGEQEQRSVAARHELPRRAQRGVAQQQQRRKRRGKRPQAAAGCPALQSVPNTRS